KKQTTLSVQRLPPWRSSLKCGDRGPCPLLWDSFELALKSATRSPRLQRRGEPRLTSPHLLLMHEKTRFDSPDLSQRREFAPPLRRAPQPGLWLLSLFCWIFPACDEEKPYRPFQIATSLPEPSAPAPSSPDLGVGPDPLKGSAIAKSAPPGSKSWLAFDRTITAPPSTVIALGIELAAGPPDAVAVWFLSEDGRPPAGDAGLWLVDKSGRPTQRLLAVDEKLPKGSDCHFRAQLTQSGPKSITSRLRSECSSRILPGTP